MKTLQKKTYKIIQTGHKFLSFEPGKKNALLNQMKKKMMMIILLLIKLIYMLRIQMM